MKRFIETIWTHPKNDSFPPELSGGPNVTLELNTKERLWLKGIMQNPIECTTEEELTTERRMRKLFFEALDV